MVSKNVFTTKVSPKNSKTTPKVAPVADTKNTAGGLAYDTGAKHTLAQIACTGTFNGTFYAGGEHVLGLAEKAIEELWSDPQYVAKVAIYSRNQGYMKDLPAYIVAKLADVDKVVFRQAFRQVVNNGKMLRNVIRIARSGRLNKRYNMSSGMWRHAIRDWFSERDVNSLFRAAIGNDPSMADIIKMARPNPKNDSDKAQLYRYLIGKEVHLEELPEPIRSYEAYRRNVDRSTLPNVDFRYLSDLDLSTDDWKAIAVNASWTMTRMNLNTFLRHGVFDDKKMVDLVADRLRNPELIKKAKAFPYQLFMACKAATGVPFEIQEALQDAMEVAVAGAPVFQGKTYIGIDVSGSMTWGSITGNRGSATSQVRPVDAAALYASSMLRNNRSATVMPFSDRLYPEVQLSGRDSVLTNTKTLSSLRAGGTSCQIVLEELNRTNAKADAVVYLSDNESWIDNRGYRRGTAMMNAWVEFKKRNPGARLVLLDLQPSGNSQVTQHDDILQVGGFSDTVYGVVERFLKNGHDTDHWVSEIEKVSLT